MTHKTDDLINTDLPAPTVLLLAGAVQSSTVTVQVSFPSDVSGSWTATIESPRGESKAFSGTHSGSGYSFVAEDMASGAGCEVRTQYTLSGLGKSPMGVSERFTVAPPKLVIIEPPQNTIITNRAVSFLGYGSLFRARVEVRVVPDGPEFWSSTAGGSTWAVMANGLPKNKTVKLVAVQIDGGIESEPSDEWTVIVLNEPLITVPQSGDIIREYRPKVSGSGLPGATVSIQPSGVDTSYGQALVAADGKWETVLQRNLPVGPFTFTARQTLRGYDSGWAVDVPVNVRLDVTVPRITSPAAGAVVDETFTLSGADGEEGAIAQVFVDLSENKLGQANVQMPAGTWSVPVSRPAGPVSLVAKQIIGALESPRSTARSFKVRPPAITAVTVTFPSETTVKFAGTGHTGATLEITVVSGPGGTAPPAAQVTAGKWETTATNWPFGTYNLKAIQKVSDNANGWIESQLYAFTVNRVFPDPSDVTYTKDYQPTFSGKGYSGATVKLPFPGGGSTAAPDARVVNGQWSSRASEVWGPVLEREVHIKQFLNGQESPNWIILKVTIAPLAPVMNEPVENGLSPQLSGTCWPGAVLKLKYSDSPTEHAVDNQNGTWNYRRAEPFESGKTHTVTITQTAAQQTSPAAPKTFVVKAPIPRPVITEPEADSEVGRDVTIKGDSGMAGATMQLRDAQFGGNLGEPKRLTGDGAWSIDLSGLDYREYTIDARQTFNNRDSERSVARTFKAVLLPPVITLPKENGDLPRTATIEGWAMPNGRVEVRLEGVAEPLLTNIAVGFDGRWKAEVTLPVGAKTIRARQTADGQASKDSQALNFNVVPAAPYLETPAAGERVGRRVVVSGFGVPGDTVTVKLGDVARQVRAQSPVLEDRTWSVTVEIDQPGGRYGLVAVASCEGFESVDSPARSVELGTYLPSFDRPAAGHRVSNPVRFQGQGRPGGGQVISWFNPDLSWTTAFTFTTVGWQAPALGTLPSGGNWCRFFEVFSGEGESIYSDTVETSRFDVLPPSAQS
ncbi:hypothetical protein [Pseudomonas sp. NPDC086278]|uniref:hypothetical protein n=1 Tax=Pseudomonas sp. NPDC086278 TaxID=3390646 RepID=UPI003CFF28B5